MALFWTWLIGTRAGRCIVATLAALGAAAALCLKTFMAGKAAEKRNITDETLRAAESRKDAADTVRGLDTADVRKRLRLWSREGAGD